MTAAPSVPLLYHCSPLRAWITEATCARNAKLGRAAAKARPGSEDRMAGLQYASVCPGCIGAVAITEAEGREPRPATDFRSGPVPVAARPPTAARPSAKVKAADRLRRLKAADSDTITAAEIVERGGFSSLDRAREATRGAGIKRLNPEAVGRGAIALWPRAPVLAWLSRRAEAAAARAADAATPAPVPLDGLTTAEVAERLKLKLWTARDQLQRSGIKPLGTDSTRHGAPTVWPRAEVLAWIEKRKGNPPRIGRPPKAAPASPVARSEAIAAKPEPSAARPPLLRVQGESLRALAALRDRLIRERDEHLVHAKERDAELAALKDVVERLLEGAA